MATLYVALFSSGAAALIYQSTWGRMLQRVFGVSDYAIATVLATFFLGLGLGSALGGRFGDRVKRPARIYALLEVGVALWALASLWLVPRVHSIYSGLGAEGTSLTVVRFLLAVLILLPPTTLMGATLPMMISAAARRGIVWERSATWLYAVNTFGAVLGAGVTGLYLVPVHGARASIVVAAGASLFAALIVFLAWRKTTLVDDPIVEPEEASTDEPALPTAVRTAALLAAGAGFASLAGEVLWTRVLRMVVQGTTQAFAAMLVNFLIGIALGSLIANRLARRFDARWLFAGTQLLLSALTLGSIWTATQTPRLVMLIHESTLVVPHEWSVLLAASAVLLFPIALTLGTSIPLAWRIAGGHGGEAADHGGKVLAANTLGGLVGSLVAGFVLVPLLQVEPTEEMRAIGQGFAEGTSGVERALVVVAAVHALMAAAAGLAATHRSPLVVRLLTALVPVSVLSMMLWGRPTLHLPYLLDSWYDPTTALVQGPDDTWNEGVRVLEEGRNTTVTVIDRGESLRLFNDGRPESGIGGSDPGFGEELVVLGSLPTLYAAEPERAMIVGLGGAHSTAVALGGPYEQVDVVELEHAIVNAARFLYTDTERDFPLDDPRANLIIDDARAQLVLAEPGTYDAVISQPSHPWLAGSSALYTVEFFQEVQRALDDGGVLSLWSNLFRIEVQHLRRIVATLLEVFDDVHAYVAEDSSFILVAGDGDFSLGQRYAERVASEGLRPYLRPFAMDDLADYASVMELDTAGARAFAAGSEPLVDDKPALEFELAKLEHFSGLELSQLDWAFRDVPWISAETFAGIPEELRADLLLQRIGWVGLRWHQLERLREQLPEYELDEKERALIEGALAEQIGDVGGAIEGYEDALPDPRAHFRLSLLLDEERLWDRQLRLGREQADGYHSARRLLRAALARPSGAATALAVAEATNDGSDVPLREVLKAVLADDCAAVMEAVERYPLALDDELGARHAMRCAFATGDRGPEIAARWDRVRRAVAKENRDLGQEALNERNHGLAMRYFRRALMANEADARSATSLSQLLSDLERHDDAAEVLRSAHRAARGLTDLVESIESQATALGVDLVH